jgi:hypothetical protein
LNYYGPTGTYFTGGYVITVKNPLPACRRPKDAQYYTISNNDGFITPYLFPAVPLSTPQLLFSSVFYAIIDTVGNLTITAGGTQLQLIPPGSHCLMSTTVAAYKSYKPKCLGKEFIIQSNFTNASKAIDTSATDLRDSHVNDTYQYIVVYTWSDNSQQDQTNGNLDAFVGVAKGNKKFHLQNLTNLTGSDNNVFDAAAAINRNQSMFPGNIIVTWEEYFYTTNTTLFKVAVSNDYGQSFPTIVDVTNLINPSFGPDILIDARGALADKFGNLYFGYNVVSAIDFSSYIGVLISSDGGNTWTVMFSTPPSETGSPYDYPQIAVGNDPSGGYNLYIVSDFLNLIVSNDDLPVFITIPVSGLGIYGTATTISLELFSNVMMESQITVADDGTIFLYSNNHVNSGFAAYPAQMSANLLIRPPLPLPIAATDFQGPFSVFLLENGWVAGVESTLDSGGSYFPVSVQGIQYDNDLEALYVI